MLKVINIDSPPLLVLFNIPTEPIVLILQPLHHLTHQSHHLQYFAVEGDFFLSSFSLFSLRKNWGLKGLWNWFGFLWGISGAGLFWVLLSTSSLVNLEFKSFIILSISSILWSWDLMPEVEDPIFYFILFSIFFCQFIDTKAWI